mgnify:CR=1 FL=1
MDVKVVIFDWDGTLVDSVDHIADSLHQAATELGYPELEREAYRDIIGLGMIEALEKLYPGITREEMTAIREGYARYFFSKVTTPQNVFAGMADVLADLRAAGRAIAPINVGGFNGGEAEVSHDRCIRSVGLTGYSVAVSVCRTETLRIMTGSWGTSAMPRDLTVFLLAMASTTPIPPVTLPNTA